MVISQQKMELFNENIIPTRTLREIVSLDNVVANQSIVNGSFNGGTITIGSKENVFKVDRNGIYLGASSFSVAPFRVDMQGNLVASSATIAGDIVSDNYVEGVSGYKLEYETGNAYLGNAIISGSSIIGDNNVLARTIGSSINQSGQFIKDVVNTNLSTATKQILGDFTFGSYGAIKMITDDNNGVWLSPTGILGKKAGEPTFTIGIDGKAIFSGVLQTGSSGQYILLDPFTGGGSNPTTTIFFVDNGTYVASISGNVDRPDEQHVLSDFVITSGLGFDNGVIGAYFDTNGANSHSNIYMGIGYGLDFLGISVGNMAGYAGGATVDNQYIWFNLRIKNDIIPFTNNNYSLGSSSYRWTNIHTNSITLNGVTRTSWPASFSGNLSDLYINTTKSWGSYGITGLGTITPYSNNSYDLGSSSYYWRNVYGINIIPSGSYTSYLGNSSYYWDYFYVDTIRGAGGTNSIEIENNAFTRYLFPASNVTYDLGSSSYFYKNVFTQSLRLRTGQSTNPANDGEIRYYDVEGGGYRGRVRGYLMQFDGTLK